MIVQFMIEKAILRQIDHFNSRHSSVRNDLVTRTIRENLILRIHRWSDTHVSRVKHMLEFLVL